MRPGPKHTSLRGGPVRVSAVERLRDRAANLYPTDRQSEYRVERQWLARSLLLESRSHSLQPIGGIRHDDLAA